ncbi:ComEA family DNA-binding protein [Achromobacter aegrifaciens]
MNPFLQSAAARPAPQARWRRQRSPVGSGARPRPLRQVLRALLVTAGLGLVAPLAHALDVNQANAQQLEGVRGIGPRMAEIIVKERERGGKFESLNDLAERVRGIGPKKAQALQEAGLLVGGAAPQAGPGEAAAKPAQGRAAAARSEAKPETKPATPQPAARARP